MNFVKLKKIGKGGQGTVFRGTNSDGLQFALKKVDDRADAQREVEALKRVGEHPNVVRVHGTEIVDDTAYVLMDLLQGESLGDYRGSFRWTTNTWWTTVLLPLLRGSLPHPRCRSRSPRPEARQHHHGARSSRLPEAGRR